MTIGDFPAWSAPQARKRAAELRRLVDGGGDPLGDRQTERRSWPALCGLIEPFYRIAGNGRPPVARERP